jgi:hypothetical protein
MQVPEAVVELLAAKQQQASVPTPTKSRKAHRQSLSSTPNASSSEPEKEAEEEEDEIPIKDASEVISKTQDLDIDKEITDLRAKLRKLTKEQRELKKSLSSTTATYEETSLTKESLTGAVKDCERDAGGMGLVETVSAIVMGKDGLKHLKAEGERLLKITGKAAGGAGGEGAETTGEDIVSAPVAVAAKAGIKIKGGKGGIKGMMDILKN